MRLIDRQVIPTFSGQLCNARAKALQDSEEFDGVIHALERIGSYLSEKISHLKGYENALTQIAKCSALANDIPSKWPQCHNSFSELYEMVRNARNDAVHQGAFARHLTDHAVELSLILEDALRQSLDNPVVADYMIRNPICAELWQPISFIRQQMLANSFSFLPVRKAEGWHLISDLQIVEYLGSDKMRRNERLSTSLEESGITLQAARICNGDTPLTDAIAVLDGDPRPLLVGLKNRNEMVLLGIVTAFDLL